MSIALSLLGAVLFLQPPEVGAVTALTPEDLRPHPRLVALSPLVAEWTAELLGCERARKRLVGVSDYSDDPECLVGIPSIGPYHRFSVERVLALKPDLVIGSDEYNGDQARTLRAAGLRVELLPKETFLGMPEWIRRMGSILGVSEAAGGWAKRWSAELDELRRKRARRRASTRVFVEIQHEPLMGLGGGSFLSEALAAAGKENVFSKLREGYPRVSPEAVLKENPDEIYILDLRDQDRAFELSRSHWQKYPGLKAARMGKITRLPGRDFARCTPRLLGAVKGLD